MSDPKLRISIDDLSTPELTDEQLTHVSGGGIGYSYFSTYNMFNYFTPGSSLNLRLGTIGPSAAGVCGGTSNGCQGVMSGRMATNLTVMKL